MKALMMITLVMGSVWSGNQANVIANISSALKSGNTSAINQYFANSVDVTILDFQDFLDKGATIAKVNAFFADKSISGYKIIHEGKSKGRDSVYTIGTLKTQQGNYKIYMFITTSHEGSNFIEEIKIEQ